MRAETTIVGDGEAESAPSARADHLRRIVLGLTAFVVIYAFWLASERTWDPDHLSGFSRGSEFFFWSQADSMLQGQLHAVTPGHDWWLECFKIDLKCYGYFGIAPSILRMPAFLALGDSVVGLGPLFAALGIGLAFWAGMDLVRQMLEQHAARVATAASSVTRWLVLAGVLLGPGSALVLLARGRAYEEAGAWGAAFLCLTLNLVYRWSRSRSNVCLYGAIAAGTMATWSRPSAIPAVVVLGVAVVLLGWKWGGPAVRVLGVGLAAIPPLLFAVVFVRKFGSLGFPWKTYGPYTEVPAFRRTIDNNDLSTVGLRFILTNLANYFRPDSIGVHLGDPLVTLQSVTKDDLIILPTANAGQVWGDRMPSLTNVMPIPLLFTCVAVAQQGWLVVKRKVSGMELMPAVLLAAALAACVPAIMYYALAGRYLGDFYPLMVVGTGLALPLVMRLSTREEWWGRALFPTLAVLAAASCVVLFQIQESVY